MPDIPRVGAGSFTIALHLATLDNGQQNGRVFGSHHVLTAFPGVIFNYNSGDSANANIAVHDAEDDLLSFFRNTVGPEGRITDGQCHWLILVVDRDAQVVRAYIDELMQSAPGELLGEVPLVDLRVGGSVNQGDPTGTGSAATRTNIFDLMIWDVALTPTQVDDLLATGLVPCNVADLAPPFSILDISDTDAFISAFLAGDASADLVAPFGIVDIDDIDAFITAFLAGCP